MKLQILLLLLLHGNIIKSQPCPTGAVYIISQEAADAFIANYPDCTELPAALTIQGADILSLHSLKNIKIIHGEMIVNECYNLSELSGLNALERVDGFVRIQNNPGLESMSGLESLETVTGDFFYISNNPRVKDLKGLEKLNSVVGRFQLFQMDSLTNIESLHNLTYTGDEFLIFRNQLLTRLNGLEKLEYVKGLRIYENISLSSVEALSPALIIEEWLQVSDNPGLADCAVSAFCAHLEKPGSKASILNNAAGCSSKQEVHSACVTASASYQNPVAINIFPNPASSILSLDVPEAIKEVEITGLNGYGIKIPAAHNQIDIQALFPGLYIGSAVSGDRSYKFKFIKSK